MDETSYNFSQMSDLSGQINSNNQKFNELTNQMDDLITGLEANWNTTEPTALELYNSLKAQWNTYKNNLNEGYELINEFKQRVDNQAERYQQAQNKIDAQIGA